MSTNSQPVALRQLRARARPPRSSPRESAPGWSVRRIDIGHVRRPIAVTTELSSNSGMYSASTTTAMIDAHDDEHHRLDQRDEPRDLGLDLLVVEVGEAVQHLLQRAGRLADFDHLHRDVRERRRARAAPRRSSALPARGAAPRPAPAPDTGSTSTRTPISSALTSGMPPPSSVASVRASCAVANLRIVSPAQGSCSSIAIEAVALRRAARPSVDARRPRRPTPTSMQPDVGDHEIRDADDDPGRERQRPVEVARRTPRTPAPPAGR